eukprot:COSAG05_NODE_38_length_27626_cov_78.614306_11_plen_74_part_00
MYQYTEAQNTMTNRVKEDFVTGLRPTTAPPPRARSNHTLKARSITCILSSRTCFHVESSQYTRGGHLPWRSGK